MVNKHAETESKVCLIRGWPREALYEPKDAHFNALLDCALDVRLNLRVVELFAEGVFRVTILALKKQPEGRSLPRPLDKSFCNW